MGRIILFFVSIMISVLLSSCVVSSSNGNEGMTTSIEQFTAKYPDLNPTYYDVVVDIEGQIANGKALYDRYYKVKLNENKVDYETRRGALEIFKKAIERLNKVANESDSYTIMSLRSEVSRYMQDLLRDVEAPGSSDSPSVP